MQNREKIEEHLRQRHGELFGLDRAVLPYDLTNRHFAGIGVGSAKAKRGKNKHKRDDCVQIVVGMVFATEGFEAGPSDLCGQPEKPDREAVQEPGQQSCEDNAHVLRPNRNHFSRAEPWRLYMTLSRAEKGFKALKCNLGLRPNHHQIERRVEGNLFITILTYLLLRLIEGTLEQQGVSRCWPTIKRILQTHTYATLILPTGHGEVYRLPKEGTPE